jgi:hypothetical protein
VQNPGASVIQAGQQIFTVSIKGIDAAVPKLPFEGARRVRDSKAFGAGVDPHAGERPADEPRLQVPTDRLDLG